MYARRLTKEELMKSGITEVTKDARVFKGDREEVPKVNNGGYFFHFVYDLDKNGKRIKVPSVSSAFGYVYKQRTIGLHRLVWAWFNDEVPEGMVVDHINNKHDELKDYELSNLQLLTPLENVRKNASLSTAEMPCKIDRPRSYYEAKLHKFTALYENAKARGDQDACHKCRAQLYQYRAKLRYWDSHEAEHHEAMRKQELLKELKSLSKQARKIQNYELWHELVKVIKDYKNISNDFLEEIVQHAQEG